MDCSKLVSQQPDTAAGVIEKLYSSRLIGQEPSLVLHGGGNGSIKMNAKDMWGNPQPCVYVKASGSDLATLTAEELPAIKSEGLSQFLGLDQLSDDQMASAVRQHLLDPGAASPSIEALVHGVLPACSIDHTHADAVLTLSLLEQGQEILEALYPDFLVLPYCPAGFGLAKAVAEGLKKRPEITGFILMFHGIITFGENSKASYDLMIEAVTQAEAKVEALAQKAMEPKPASWEASAKETYLQIAPVLRGALNRANGGPSLLLFPLFDPEIQPLIDLAPELLESGPLTPDHLIRTKSNPLVLRDLNCNDLDTCADQIKTALASYQKAELAYLGRHQGDSAPELDSSALTPKVVLIPHIGAIALGSSSKQGLITLDILRQTLWVKQSIWKTGQPVLSLDEAHLYEMEYRPLQLKKLAKITTSPMSGRVALISGAAGAIGSGVGNELAAAGAQVVLTDLPGDHFNSLVETFERAYPGQIFSHPMDVTDESSVHACLDAVAGHWGGLDLMVINAGLAHVSKLSEMDVNRFRKLEQVNVEGTLLMLKTGAKFFESQGCGGDVVLISTKNVFSPSASFGAYSATKAASHQLARVASLELADIDVRVNMVSPDGVFSDQGGVKSGLWATVGPDRMKARGLDQEGLETYYQNRNLLKTKVTARHVGKAVLYFATRQSPCTGATLPVDGGLPDATPR